MRWLLDVFTTPKWFIQFIPWIKGCPLVPGWNLWPCCGSASQRPRDWTRGRYLSLGASKYWSKGWWTTFDGFWCRDFFRGMSSILRQCLHTISYNVIHDFESYSILSWTVWIVCLSGKLQHIPRSKSDALGSWCKDCRRSFCAVKICWFGGLFNGDVSRILIVSYSNVMECSSISITIYNTDVYV